MAVLEKSGRNGIFDNLFQYLTKIRMAANLDYPLTPAQLEILKVLARPMSEDEIIELKRTIVKHFAAKLSHEAAMVWDKNEWKANDTAKLRKRHFRSVAKND
jgi:uncharacterized protein (DUF2267 family)